MRTLVIDNVDSFVYNLVQLIGMEGGNPIVAENKATKSEIDKIVSDGIDRIVISPGPKRPEDAGISNYVIETFGKSIPTLGVCLGHQCIGHVFGAKVSYAKRQMHGKTSTIDNYSIGILRGLPSRFEAVRYHSLSVSDLNLPNELRVTARTADDDREIMAIQHRNYPIYGLQFHPESIMTKDGIMIIREFLGANHD